MEQNNKFDNDKNGIVEYLKAEIDKVTVEKNSLTRQLIQLEGEKSKIQALYEQESANWNLHKQGLEDKEKKMKSNHEKMFQMLKNCGTETEMSKVAELQGLCKKYSGQIEEYKTKHSEEKRKLIEENSGLNEKVSLYESDIENLKNQFFENENC